MPAIQIHSSRFGTVDVPESDVVEFPEGLVGLGGSRYAIVRPDDGGPFAWLQSADDAGLALPITDPWAFFPEYELELSDAATAAAGLPEDGAGVAVWVTVRAASTLEDFCANLRAPIAIHGGRGHQVLNEAPGWSVRAPLFDAPATRAA